MSEKVAAEAEKAKARDLRRRRMAAVEDKWWDGTLVSRTGKKHKEFPLHYCVKYPDGRQAYSPLPRASYGVDGEWLIIVKSRVKR